MNIAFVGCGFVFDIYVRTIRAHPELVVKGVYDINTERLIKVSEYYGFRIYDTYEELLEDDAVDAVINLTSIKSHFEVSRRALLHGKHVYTEKPLTTRLEETRKLFSLQGAGSPRLYCAPCNIFSDTVRTMFKAVKDGAIGKPLIVYAELDDNPITKMGFEAVKSPTGAKWPLEDEIREGCTFEHVGYHLTWICGLLGPAVSVTAFSCELLDNKMAGLKSKVGTPDYSVACLHFANGATARITCSVVAPRDHRMRIIGTEGEIHSDSYRQYKSPVSLERYSKGSLTARKFRSLCKYPNIGRLFGIGGRVLKQVRHSKSFAVEKNQQLHSSLKQRFVEWIRRREVYAQDKLLGISEMKREIDEDQTPYLSTDFLTHINELTLLIQRAGSNGTATKPATSFETIGDIPGSLPPALNYADTYRPALLERLLMR